MHIIFRTQALIERTVKRSVTKYRRIPHSTAIGWQLMVKKQFFVSFSFKALQEVYDKQESVPYNISIGGGTQGLADTVGLNYMDYPAYELPLERHFGGTFLGDIRLFKFWQCPMNYANIKRFQIRY